LLTRDTLKIELFRNDDSIEVIINEIYSTNPNFRIAYFTRDTILQPGEKYYVEIYYYPQTSEPHTGTLEIIYCGQWNVKKYIHLKGRGIGTFFNASHYYLPFIPEIQERNISITNTGNAALNIDSVDIEPTGYYSCITPLPINVGVGESVELTIRCNDMDNIVSATMNILALPCARSNEVKLMPYIGTASLKIPLVETDPRNDICYIPIILEQTEHYSYAGERFLDFEISINPTLFLPKYAVSDYGIVDIKFDKIDKDKRLIGLRFTGNINDNKTELLRLYGIPLLGNTDTSTIAFNSNSLFFGEAVSVKTEDGLFRIEVCQDRFLGDGSGYITLNSVTPNPATNFINVEYEVFSPPKNGTYLQLYDIAGSLIFNTKISSDIGIHSYKLDVFDYASGSYMLRIVYEDSVIISGIIKI
jgi:hypothetical protein